MNLLTKTGLITATSLGLIACGGANNGSNTPNDNAPKAPAASAQKSSEALRSAMSLPFMMATAVGQMSYKFQTYNASNAGEPNATDLKYKGVVAFNDYVNNDIKVDGNAYLQTQFTLFAGPKNDGTKIENGTLTYGFDLTADDLTDLSGAVSAKDKRTCNFNGEKAKGYTLLCSRGDTVKTPSEKYTFDLHSLGGYWLDGFSFNGTFGSIDGGPVNVKGENLKVCPETGLLGEGKISITRTDAGDLTTIEFNKCATPGFTATYASENLPKTFTMKALPTK